MTHTTPAAMGSPSPPHRSSPTPKASVGEHSDLHFSVAIAVVGGFSGAAPPPRLPIVCLW